MHFNFGKPITIEGSVSILTTNSKDELLLFILNRLERKKIKYNINKITTDTKIVLSLASINKQKFSKIIKKIKDSKILRVNQTNWDKWVIFQRTTKRGIDTPLSHNTKSFEKDFKNAKRLGFPCIIKSKKSNESKIIKNEKEFTDNWNKFKNFIIQEYLYTEKKFYVIIIGGKVIEINEDISNLVEHNKIKKLSDKKLNEKISKFVENTCVLIGINVGIVKIIQYNQKLLLLDILPAESNLRKFSLNIKNTMTKLVEFIIHEMISIQKNQHSVNYVKKTNNISSNFNSIPKISIAITIQDSNALRPIWLWYKIARELKKQGNNVMYLEKESFNKKILDEADFIWQDPIKTFRKKNGVEIMNYSYEHHRHKTHYAQKISDEGKRMNEVTKEKAYEISKKLNVPHPKIYDIKNNNEIIFPAIKKPNKGRGGRGIKLIHDKFELEQTNLKRAIVQEYIDSGLNLATSIRLITVKEKIVASAVFYNENKDCSNLHNGGNAIALTGIHRDNHISQKEEELLRKINIEPYSRKIPEEVITYSSKVGNYLSSKGIQILGQDFVIDKTGKWYFIEANSYPGYLLFGITDGDRRQRILSGYYIAPKIIAQEISKQFS